MLTVAEIQSEYAPALADAEIDRDCARLYLAKHMGTEKKGKHSFSVTAIDASGNSGTTATDHWKVKKKKKK